MKLQQRFLRRLGVGSDLVLTTLMQGCVALLSFALQALIIRTLKVEETGLYFLALGYVTIAASIGDFGLIATVFPRVAVTRGFDAPAFKAGLLLRLTTIGLGCVFLNVYLAARGYWELLPIANAGYAGILFSSRLTGTRQFIELLWRLQGRTYIVSVLVIVDVLLSLAAIVVLRSMGSLTVLSATAAISAASIPGFVLAFWPLLRRIRAAGFFTQRIPRQYYRLIFLASVPIAIMSFTGQAFGQLETLVVSSYLGLKSTGSYAAAVRPINASLFLAVFVGFGIAPLISQVNARKRFDVTVQYLVSLSIRIVGLLGLFICAFCNVFYLQILSIFGNQYIGDSYILRIFSGINILVFFVIALDQCLLAFVLRKETLYGAVLSFIVALVLELLVVGSSGVSGILIAKSVAEIFLIVFQLRMLGAEARSAAISGFRKLLIPAAALGVSLAVSQGLPTGARAGVVGLTLAAAVILTDTVSVSELRLLGATRIG